MNKQIHIQDGLRQVITILSLLVILGVFWSLKLTGITMAGEAFCGKEEHVHSEECLKGTLICQMEEIPAHSHDDTCLKTLICQQEEGSGHVHTEGVCFEKKLICQNREEGHVHAEEACYEKQWICQLQEREAHAHTEECWQTGESVVCGLEETQGHTHGDACYEWLEYCPLEEHIHDPNCYSNYDADLETSTTWEASLPEFTADASAAEKLIQVARSQLGYTESTLNFTVDEKGNRRGITRYGQWYGNSYADWSAMFASFCLHYAGIEDLPTNAGPEAMRLEWETENLYGAAEDFSPETGYLLFADKDQNGTADAVAIITAVEDGQIRVIEGDLENTVAETTYAMDDVAILGYGRVHLEPELTFIPQEGAKLIGHTENYSQELFADGSHLVIYLEDESGFYAIDGNGDLAEITIAPDGRVYTELETPNLLLWHVTSGQEGRSIQNLTTGMYLPDAATLFGGINTFAAGDETAGSNINYQYARAVDYNVWLDGTNGNIMAYRGSADYRYTVTGGTAFKLPETWQSPTKYSYVLAGWYDVNNNKYYAPGEEVIINGNTVFYADWKAATYDIGHFNSQVADTVSTNSFITTRMFDYGILMNVLSERASVSFSNNDHTETWSLLSSGNNPYNNTPTMDFILRDWDVDSQDITFPNAHNGRNNPTNAGEVYQGLYTDAIRKAFFDPDLKLPGKQYLGEGDHLFQLCLDPGHEHYGYYYYNSERNAASYNQTDQRFYVYEYLSCTKDSANNTGNGKYADFLPLNSPHANTNGKTVNTYSYAGVEGEYGGTTHYMYDSRYSDNNNSPNNVYTNFWFGMSMEVEFYLPNDVGALVSGGYGNQDIYGKDMHFRFSGDDDVWIFIDDKLVLDLGGLHGMETGDINFSTGIVTINGVEDTALSNRLKTVKAGERKLTLYYLERGGSMSNCAIYFNLAPRFSFSIQKEDVLTREVLDGAVFSVYTDRECINEAELWPSKEAHDRGDTYTNEFTVKNGVANMWGMGAGNTYYIRETSPPADPDYGFPNGLIKLTFDKTGTANYQVEILNEGAGVSPGFIVHGFRIDEETQQAYIVATNAPKWVTATTSVQVMKEWKDDKDHSGDAVTVYLTAKNSENSYVRIQEAVLNADNEWHAIWENLPKFQKDGVTPVEYAVEEAYTPGYYSSVEKVSGNQFTITGKEWKEANTFENGKVYLLKNTSGQCLSTLQSAADTGYMWVSQDVAKESSLAKWTASVNGNNVRLTNQANQTITFYYGNGSPTDFFAYDQHVEDNNRKQYLRFSKSGSGFTLQYDGYYLSSVLNNSYKFAHTTANNSALIITPVVEQNYGGNIPIKDQGYLVTNTPLKKETSLTVQKYWDYGKLPPETGHEKAYVTVKLLANGKDTGRTVTLTLKNGWNASFRGLPYEDEFGNPIAYTVKETWENTDWIPVYGDVVTHSGDPPNYSTTITNYNRWGTAGPELPSTGTSARMMYMLCGSAILLGTLVYGMIIRRKRERRI